MGGVCVCVCTRMRAHAGHSTGVPACSHLLDLGGDPPGQGLHFLWLLRAPCALPQTFPHWLWFRREDFSQALPSLEQFAEKWGTDQVLGRPGGAVSLVSELAVGR